MADNHSKQQRQYNMSRIKSKNTTPELIVRKYLFSKGFRYRLNVKNLPGKPDIVLRKYHITIFVNGCFWHGHVGCRYFVLPKTNSEWWNNKINATKKRDREARFALENLGWNVIEIWECELKTKTRERTLSALEQVIKNTVNGKD